MNLLEPLAWARLNGKSHCVGIACNNSRHQTAQNWICKLCLLVIQEGETLNWRRKRYRRAEAFGNIARNAEIFVYRHVLNLAAKVVRVKLSYQNRTERSLAAQSSLSWLCLCPRSTADRLLSEAELGAPESPVADKKAPGSERAAERAAAAQQNSERARLAPQPSFVNMQVGLPGWSQLGINLDNCRVKLP